MHVLICGAGLGGLSLAQCFRKQGISYEIFDRDESADSRFQGWAIAIHSIIPDLKNAFPADMPDLEEATSHLKPLNLPAQMGLFFPGTNGRFGVESTPENQIVRSERRRLRDWLSTKINIQWNKRVENVEHNERDVVVTFTDGTTARGDILIGADGINSTVRRHLLQKEASELLKVVPLAAVVGEVDLSGDAFKRQLALGHSLWMYMDPSLGFFNFGGLHQTNPDGQSGRHYWMLMQPDGTVADPAHALKTASQEEKRKWVMQKVEKLPSKFREIFELTPTSGIRQDAHVWRDLELEHLPACRVVLVGDAAHAMTPFRGEGGFHTLIDSMNLAKALGAVDTTDYNALQAAVESYNKEMLERGGAAVRASRSVQAPAAKNDGGKPKLIAANQAAKLLPERPFSEVLNAPTQVQA